LRAEAQFAILRVIIFVRNMIKKAFVLKNII
jgi:hypothetical protein